MTLTTYDFEQRSPEWYEARCGIVTASAVGRLITPATLKPADNDEARKLTAALVAERITGFVDPTFTSADMYRGIEAEPYAREKYGEHYAEAVECGFMVREWGPIKLGYSPDGLVGDVGLIEVKAPRAKEHLRTILADEVPPYYMAQLQAGLLVSERKWIDYVSFYGGMPLWVKRVRPDSDWRLAILEALRRFEINAVEMAAAYKSATSGLPMTERLPDPFEVELKL